MQSEAKVDQELAALTRLHNLAMLSADEASLEPILGEIVEAAIGISGADFGSIQLLDAASSDLKIAAQRGFAPCWLDFWESTQAGQGTCGTALENAKRVVVEDVEQSPIFLGTPALEIQRRAGVRAVQSTPLVSRSGKPVGVLSTHYRSPHRPDELVLQLLDLLARQGADVIELAQNKAALRASEARLKRVRENEAVGALFLDRTGTVIDANEFFLTMTGYTRADVQGRELTWRRMTPPEWVKKTKQQYDSIATTGRLGPYEKECFLKDGSRRWMLFAGRDLGDGTISEYCIDITERKTAETARQQSEERYRSLVLATSAFVWIADINGELSHPQPAWELYTGQSWQQHDGNNWINAVHPNDRARVAEAWRHAVATRSLYEVEWRAWHAPSGQWRHCLTRGAPVLGFDGEVCEWIGAVTDIHDRKMLEARLQQEDKLASLGVLAGGIAHDFNNLLGSVLAQADLALLGLAAGVSHEEELRIIRDVALRGSEIVGELMIYAGKETVDLGPIDVSQIVTDMRGLLKVSVSKHAMLETHLSQDLPAVQANAAQLRQIVLNLVTNASDAIGEQDGMIFVRTEYVKVNLGSETISGSLAPGNYVLLEISDTGRGMPLEMQAKIFDPFFTTKSAGHGLGLAVVRGIVHGVNGVIQVKSEPGKGATFQIYMPCDESKADVSREVVSSVGEPGGPSQDGTVLVVEDEVPLRQAVTKMLHKAGFEVFEAGDGSTAIDLIGANGGKIDVILLDMTIPGASSAQVIAEAARVRPDIRVVLTSAYSQEMIASAMTGAQIRGFIRKPFQLRDLERTLRNTL